MGKINQNYRNLIKYCYEILKHSRHGQHLFLNIREEAKYFVDISDTIQEEILLFDKAEEISISKSQKQIEENRTFEKLRRIYDNYTNNPYELEIIYCYLFVEGRTNDGKEVFAPLFTIPAELTYEENKRSFVLSLASDELRLNTFALVDLYPERESALFSRTGGIRCPELPLTLKSVNQVLKKIADLHPAIKCNMLDTINYPQKIENDLEMGKFTLYNSGGIALAKKDNVYLINDLRELLDSEVSDFESSVLKRFVKKNYTSNDNNYDSEEFSWKVLLTPFPANSPQIKVMKELGDNQLLHVQGPPGTGKSQTIANLVSHLVANRFTVLVTSQKNKALQVVSEMLDKLKIKYLYMQLLKDDKESKKKIKEVISELLSEVLSYDSKQLKNHLGELEELLDKCNEKLSELYEEFIQAQKFEYQKLDELNLTIGEVYFQYEKLKSFDIFEKNEFIPFSEKSSTTDILFHYLSELEKIASDYILLEKLSESENIPKTQYEIDQFSEGIEALKSLFEREISFISPERVDNLSKTLPCLHFLENEELQESIIKITKIKNEVYQYISYLDLIEEYKNYFLGKVVNTVWRKPKAFIVQEKLRPQLNIIFGEWLAMKNCNPKNKNEIFSKIGLVLSAINALRIRKQIEILIDKLALNVQDDIIFCQNRDCRQKLRTPLNKGRINIKCPKCKREFPFYPDELMDETITFNLLKSQLFHSYVSKNFEQFNKVYEKTKYLLILFPVFLKVSEIEQQQNKGYRRTIFKIKDMCLSDESQFKFFSENIEKIIEAGVLKGIIKEGDKKFRSTDSTAVDIRQVNEDKNKFIRNFVETAIKYNLRENLSKSSTRNDLSYFARILQRSKKRYVALNN